MSDFGHRPPFYILAELLKPTILMPGVHGPSRCGNYDRATFQFHLTREQATDIASSRDVRPGSNMDFLPQVQLRFCLLKRTCEQDNCCFPKCLFVLVNGKIPPLPNPIPTKCPPPPINIMQQVELSPTVPNYIFVKWENDFCSIYTVSAYFVQRLSSADLLSKLRSKGVRHADITRGLIKEKLKENADNYDIAPVSLRVTLACPLGKMRMQIPCQASTCAHLQCFDANMYLQLNEQKPTWICPICNKPALFDNLVIDGYFHEVLASFALASNGGNDDIQLHGDGSWSTLEHSVNSITVVEMVCDDIPDSPPPMAESSSSAAPTSTGGSAETKKRPLEVIDLTCLDSDDEDNNDGPPPAKRTAFSILGRSDSYGTGRGNGNSSTISSMSSGGGGATRGGEGGIGRESSGESTVSSSTGPAGCGSPHVITSDSPSSSPGPPSIILSSPTSSRYKPNLW